MSISKIKKQIISDLKSAGIKSAEIDAQILIEFATGKTREFLFSNSDYELSNKQIRLLRLLSDRRKIKEPIAYITGHKEFFGLDFLVAPSVLIPRPETEFLVETALHFIESKIMNHKPRILDVGTGSGNIIISLAKNIEGDFFASDISHQALILAKINAKNQKVKIKFIQSDLFEKITDKFDLIIANLPYVPIGGSDNLEIKHEPKNAIFAKNNGTDIIEKFLNQSQKHIKKQGMIIVELDPRNALKIKDFALKIYKFAKLKKDLSGKNRTLEILT